MRCNLVRGVFLFSGAYPHVPTLTPTPTFTPTYTPSITPTYTPTPTLTITPTLTPTITYTPTFTYTPSVDVIAVSAYDSHSFKSELSALETKYGQFDYVKNQMQFDGVSYESVVEDASETSVNLNGIEELGSISDKNVVTQSFNNVEHNGHINDTPNTYISITEITSENTSPDTSVVTNIVSNIEQLQKQEDGVNDVSVYDINHTLNTYLATTTIGLLSSNTPEQVEVIVNYTTVENLTHTNNTEIINLQTSLNFIEFYERILDNLHNSVTIDKLLISDSKQEIENTVTLQFINSFEATEFSGSNTISLQSVELLPSNVNDNTSINLGLSGISFNSDQIDQNITDITLTGISDNLYKLTVKLNESLYSLDYNQLNETYSRIKSQNTLIGLNYSGDLTQYVIKENTNNLNQLDSINLEENDLQKAFLVTGINGIEMTEVNEPSDAFYTVNQISYIEQVGSSNENGVGAQLDVLHIDHSKSTERVHSSNQLDNVVDSKNDSVSVHNTNKLSSIVDSIQSFKIRSVNSLSSIDQEKAVHNTAQSNKLYSISSIYNIDPVIISESIDSINTSKAVQNINTNQQVDSIDMQFEQDRKTKFDITVDEIQLIFGDSHNIGIAIGISEGNNHTYMAYPALFDMSLIGVSDVQHINKIHTDTQLTNVEHSHNVSKIGTNVVVNSIKHLLSTEGTYQNIGVTTINQTINKSDSIISQIGLMYLSHVRDVCYFDNTDTYLWDNGVLTWDNNPELV